MTRRQCIELCLSEREFLCKSASFRQTLRNNFNRGRERDFILTNENDGVNDNIPLRGECILSREDKNSKPDAYRVTNDQGEEYIENQCVPQGQRCKIISWRSVTDPRYLSLQISWKTSVRTRNSLKHPSSMRTLFCQDYRRESARRDAIPSRGSNALE